MKNFAFAFFAVLAVCFICSAAPEPAVVQEKGEWTLDVRFEPLDQIEIRVGDEVKRYWYEIFSVTNNTDQDVEFVPNFELMTDTMQVIPAEKEVPQVIYDKLKRRYARKYPFLTPLERVDNRVLVGEDNTQDILVVWPDFDARAKEVSVFLTGFSNEAAVIDHPTKKDENGEPEKVYLRKTLELNYKIEGDPSLRSEARLSYLGKDWVMR